LQKKLFYFQIATISTFIFALLAGTWFNYRFDQIRPYSKNSLRLHEHEVLIASVGNFNGQFQSIIYPTQLDMQGSQVTLGGIPLLQSYLKIIKERFGTKSVILQLGQWFSNEKLDFSKNPEQMELVKALPIDFSLFSYHELINFFPNGLYQTELPELPQNFINSNIYSLKDRTHLKGEKLAPYAIARANGHKIGIIGISDRELISKDLPAGAYFSDSVASFLLARKKLMKQSVDGIILLVQFSSDSRDNNKHVNEFLKRIPPRSIDLVISPASESNPPIIRGTPILWTTAMGQEINWVIMNFDENDKPKVTFLPSVATCQKINSLNRRCISNQSASKIIAENFIMAAINDAIPATFLGREIVPVEIDFMRQATNNEQTSFPNTLVSDQAGK